MSGSEATNSQETAPKYLTAEFKDGQLQIVEVTPFDKETVETAVPPDENCYNTDCQPKYVQVNTSKGLMQLDLLNLTLVRCQDGEESYQVVTNAESLDGEVTEDGTVTCVLQSSDNETEEHNNQEYVMVDSENGEGPLVFLQSSLQQSNSQKEESKKAPTPAEILERARALQKAKALLGTQSSRNRGRKRKGDLPPPHELLSSPNFKLYLYSCKLCNFKCNAIKDMSAHKLMRHVQDIHLKDTVETIHLNTEEVEAADILVCGACGFESSSKAVFRIHIEDEHGAATC